MHLMKSMADFMALTQGSQRTILSSYTHIYKWTRGYHSKLNYIFNFPLVRISWTVFGDIQRDNTRFTWR